MDYIQQLRSLAERIPKQTERLGSQAATSQALVMPFIQAMGYNPFDPAETVPQFDVDLGNGKTETVDYALVQEDIPIILIDVKKWDTKLSDLHTSRLYRCFPVADARFAVLTNGIDFRIYSDVSEPNRMDRKPYFTFSMNDLNEGVLGVLAPFTKGDFDYDALLDTAEKLAKGGAPAPARAPAASPAPATAPAPQAKVEAARQAVSAAAAGPMSRTADYTPDFDKMQQAAEELAPSPLAAKPEPEPEPTAAEPIKARIRRPEEPAKKPDVADEDMRQTVLQMTAIDPSKLKADLDAAKRATGGGKPKRRMLEPSTLKGPPSSAEDLAREAKERKEKQLKPSVLSRIAAAVRGETTKDKPSRGGDTLDDKPAAGAPAASSSKKKKKKRRRSGFSETQWFMEGVKADAEVLEATTSNEKYERRDDLSDEERRKYSLRDNSED